MTIAAGKTHRLVVAEAGVIVRKIEVVHHPLREFELALRATVRYQVPGLELQPGNRVCRMYQDRARETCKELKLQAIRRRAKKPPNGVLWGEPLV
jgi:hypothetical protein